MYVATSQGRAVDCSKRTHLFTFLDGCLLSKLRGPLHVHVASPQLGLQFSKLSAVWEEGRGRKGRGGEGRGGRGWVEGGTYQGWFAMNFTM